MTARGVPAFAAAELEQFLVSLSVSRARLEELSATGVLPDLVDLVQEIDVLSEQLLTADAELRAQEYELSELSQRADRAVRQWESMFARSGTAYYLTDREGVIVNSNLAARRMLHEPEAIPTQIRPVASKFQVQYRRAVRTGLRQAVTFGESVSVRATTLPRPGGRPTQVDVLVVPVHAPGEDVLLWWQLLAVPDADVDPGLSVADLAELATMFGEVTEAIGSAEGSDVTMRMIVEVVQRRMPLVEHVGITSIRDGRPTTLAASGELPALVDQLQYQTGEGPCLDAMLSQHSFRTGDLGAEARWPEFAKRCVAESPVRSVMAFQLRVDEHTLGALNCYSSNYDAFADDAVFALGAVFAAHTGLAFTAVRQREESSNLNHALTNSRLIGAAIGILMAHHRVTQDQAFGLLREASQRTHRKLHDVADDIVHTGTLE
ncbi:MAG: GAF and ANTAR domain-containing protein [Jatrophihabitans sp.]